MKRLLLSFLLPFILLPTLSFANSSWREFLSQVKQEAVQQGVRPQVVNQAFANLTAPSRKVMKYDRTQPEKRITFKQYRSTRADRYRILIGRKKYKKYQQLVDAVARHYGVSPCFIMSFWGLETSYGHFKGSFPVIQSLATLAFDSRRAQFFRNELIFALHILNEGHIDLPSFKGEWAGASGHPQFLPSSWYHYAVDFDGDNRRDIWNNIADAFASIANYLKQNGWQTGQPWAIEVNLPQHFNSSLLGRKNIKTVASWRRLGVTTKQRAFPAGNLSAAIVYPDGGPALMVFNNFNVIMRWNRSIYYAGTIGYTAEKICRRSL